MKKIVLSLFTFLFLNNVLFSMNSDFTITSSNNSLINEEILIGKVISGKNVVTIDKNEIIDIIEKQWRTIGYKYELEVIEILVSIPDNDPSQKLYVLQLMNKDNTIKVAYFLRLESASFYLSDQSLDAGLSCTSTQCQFSCAPASLIDPKTRKPVLTCSTCTNECVKTATAG